MWGDCRGEAAKGGYRGGLAKGEGPHRGGYRGGFAKGEGRGAAPFGEAESRARSARSPPQAGGLRPGARGFCGAGEKGRAGENAGGGAGGLCKLCGKIKVTYCKRAALRVK